MKGIKLYQIWHELGWFFCTIAFRSPIYIPGVYRIGNYCYGRWDSALTARGM